MAPANDYLTTVEAVREALIKHNNRLIKETTTRFPDEEREVHWDFHRPVEHALLKQYLESCIGPDFDDGKVTLTGAANATYGSKLEDDAYLRDRLAGLLRPYSGFNGAVDIDGLVYVVRLDGTIHRAKRDELGENELLTRLGIARERLVKRATTEEKGVSAALKRAIRINPKGAAELEAQRGSVESVIIGDTRVALTSGVPSSVTNGDAAE